MMRVLNCDSYRVNVPDIEALSQKKTPEERIKQIGTLAVITGVPIIVVCHYLGELWGYTPELTARIEKLMEFYKVDGVINNRPPLQTENKEVV
jgi:hypothetical protein